MNCERRRSELIGAPFARAWIEILLILSSSLRPFHSLLVGSWIDSRRMGKSALISAKAKTRNKSAGSVTNYLMPSAHLPDWPLNLLARQSSPARILFNTRPLASYLRADERLNQDYEDVSEPALVNLIVDAALCGKVYGYLLRFYLRIRCFRSVLLHFPTSCRIICVIFCLFFPFSPYCAICRWIP